MSDRPQLRIDLADPEDIRHKLDHAEMILEDKRRVAAEAARDYENWEQLIEILRLRAGVDTSKPSDGAASRRKSAPAQDAAVRIVEREARPMRPPDVAAKLRSEGYPVKNTNAVNAALYAAAKAGRLSRPGKGLYGPADTKVPQELLASDDVEADRK